MILSTLRVFAEAGGLIGAGIAAGEVAPYLHDPEVQNAVEAKCAPLIQQSRSLSAEFMDILRKLEAYSYAKLTEVCCIDDKNRRAASKADIDELCSNLVNNDMELNNFPDMFIEAEMEVAANVVGNAMVDEQYRIIPLSEVAKLAPSSVDRAVATGAIPSSSKGSGWYRSRGNVAGVHVIDIFCLMMERDLLSSDLLNNFELQQQRIGRQLELKAASCVSPHQALSHSRAVHCSHLALYLVVCMGLDRFWPMGATTDGSSSGGGGSSGSDMYASGGSGSSADKAVADMLKQIDAADAAANVKPSTANSGAEGRPPRARRVGVVSGALSRLFAAAPKRETAPGVSAIAEFLVGRWRAAPAGAAAPSPSQASLLSSINGGFHFPFWRPRPALARALFLYLPAMCLFHYASTSLVSLAVDGGEAEGEDGSAQWDLLAATDINRPFGGSKHSSHTVGNNGSNNISSSKSSSTAGPFEGPQTIPVGRPRGGVLGALEDSLRDFVGDADEDDVNPRARPPSVWLGATQADPFTVQRVLLTVVEKPWVDGLLFQGMLFLRLLGLSGMPAAMLLTPLAYAASTTGSGHDLRAMLLELRSDDALAMNLASGISHCATFALTQRLWCPVLLSALVNSSFLFGEYRARDDLLCSESLSLWQPAVRLLSLVERYEHLSFLVENWVLPVPRLMSKNSGDSGGSGSGSGGGAMLSFLAAPKPTAELRRLSAAVATAFAVDVPGASAGGGKGKVVLSARDVEDLSEGLKQAMVAVDKRPQSELSVFERARRMEYQQYVAAVKLKHRLPDILKVLAVTAPAHVHASASTSSKSTQHQMPSSVVLNDGSALPPHLPRPDSRRCDRLQRLARQELDRMAAALATTGGGSALPVLRLLFDDTRTVALQALYPRGMRADQLEVFLAQQLADTASRQYIANHFDADVLLKQLLKWERKLAAAAGDPSLATSCESEFLDFLQHHYWSLMCELYWEAMRFEAVQIPQFLDSLAGRAATVADVQAYEAALADHLRLAGRRAVLMSLALHGLTERRFRRLVHAYGQRFPTVGLLERQWEDFFRGDRYRKTISDIVNPLAVGGGSETHRQGSMEALLALAQTQAQTQAPPQPTSSRKT